MKDYSKYMVVIFSLNEPTSNLSEYCFRKLGFENIVVLNDQSSFVEKFIKFSEIVNDTNYEYYIRSDSDRFVFNGMCDLVDSIDSSFVHFEGWGFDYFMNKFRAATPQIYHRDILLRLYNDKNLIRDVPKPESMFGHTISIKSKSLRILTNLHDYYQMPNKVCNTFLNRMVRDGTVHYDMNHIKNLPEIYYTAFKVANDCYRRSDYTVDMNYKDFSFLDEGFQKFSMNLDEAYLQLKMIYDEQSLKL